MFWYAAYLLKFTDYVIGTLKTENEQFFIKHLFKEVKKK